MKLSSVNSINVTENLIAKRIWNTMKNHPTSVNTLKTHNVCLDQEVAMKMDNANMDIPANAYISRQGGAKRAKIVIFTMVEMEILVIERGEKG